MASATAHVLSVTEKSTDVNQGTRFKVPFPAQTSALFVLKRLYSLDSERNWEGKRKTTIISKMK